MHSVRTSGGVTAWHSRGRVLSDHFLWLSEAWLGSLYRAEPNLSENNGRLATSLVQRIRISYSKILFQAERFAICFANSHDVRFLHTMPFDSGALATRSNNFPPKRSQRLLYFWIEEAMFIRLLAYRSSHDN